MPRQTLRLVTVDNVGSVVLCAVVSVSCGCLPVWRLFAVWQGATHLSVGTFRNYVMSYFIIQKFVHCQQYVLQRSAFHLFCLCGLICHFLTTNLC